MPQPGVSLFILPRKHYLEYGSCVMRQLLRQHGRGIIIALEGDEANPESIDRAIQAYDPGFIFGIGHGLPDLYTVECTQEYLRVGSEREQLMKGRIIHLNSCYTGARLGPSLVAKGAQAFLGSVEPFYFYIADPPCSSRASMTVFLAEHQAAVSILNGRSAMQAHVDRLQAYEREIEYWLAGPGRDHPHAPLLARILEVDRGAAVMHGRGEASIAPPARAAVLPMQMAAALGFTAVAASW